MGTRDKIEKLFHIDPTGNRTRDSRDGDTTKTGAQLLATRHR